MISYDKPLGTFEGLTFYGDDRNDNLVYYLPHKIDFAPRNNDNPDLDLLVVYRGEKHSGGSLDSSAIIASILSLGVECKEDDQTVRTAVDSLCAKHGKDSNHVIVSTPPWDSGKVELTILDKDQKNGDESLFVKKVLGSSIPSLDSYLKGTFNVLLNPEGTEVVRSILNDESDMTSLVLVNYDVQYTAMRPAVNIHMKANLHRCQDTMEHVLGIDFNMWYYVDFDFAFQFDWLTKVMEEDQSITIDVLSPVTTPEEQEAVDELVHEFKDFVLKQLVEPVPEMGEMVKVNKKSNSEIVTDVIKEAGPTAKAVADAVNTVKGSGGAAGRGGATQAPAASGNAQSAQTVASSAMSALAAQTIAADPTKITPSTGGTNPPSTSGTTPPSTGGTTPPSTGGTTPPSAGGTTPPSTGETSIMPGGSAYSPEINPDNYKLGVKYQFRKEKYSFDRNIEVTYNGSTAMVKHLNTSTHLSKLLETTVTTPPEGVGEATAAKPSFRNCVKEIPVGNYLLQQHVSCLFDYDFDNEDSDIRAAEVFLWKKTDVDKYLNAHSEGSGIDLKDILDPTHFESFTRDWIFRKDKPTVQAVSWPLVDGNEPGYYYRVLYTYGGDLANMYTWSKKYMTDPVFSSSEELILRPYDDIVFRNIPIRATSDVDFSAIRQVIVDLKDNEKLVGRVILNDGHKEDRFIYRNEVETDLQVEKTYSFVEADPVTKLCGPLHDDEIQVEAPTYRKLFNVSIVGLDDSVQAIQLKTSACPVEQKPSPWDTTFNLKPSDGPFYEVKIPVYSPSDEVHCTLRAVIGKRIVTLEDHWKPSAGQWKPSDDTSFVFDLGVPDSAQS